MTLALGILIIIILLAYDAMFLRLLLRRRGRVLYSLIIENGKIIKTEGKVPEFFYQQIESISEEQQPANLKITVKKSSPSDQIMFSYPINESLKSELENAFESTCLGRVDQA